CTYRWSKMGFCGQRDHLCIQSQQRQRGIFIFSQGFYSSSVQYSFEYLAIYGRSQGFISGSHGWSENQFASSGTIPANDPVCVGGEIQCGSSVRWFVSGSSRIILLYVCVPQLSLGDVCHIIRRAHDVVCAPNFLWERLLVTGLFSAGFFKMR